MNTARVLLLGVLLALAGAAGALEIAAGGAPVGLQIRSLKQVRFQATLRQQYDFSCGSAALATLLSHHYGYPTDEAAIFEQMFRDGDHAKIRREGFSLFDMKKFLATRGFGADGFQQPLAKLAEAGLPAIVLITEKGFQHFVVIKGVAHGRVLLGDPASGTRSMSLEHFHEVWRGQLLFVIHQYPGTVRFNAAADWVAAPRAPLSAGIARDGLDLITRAVHGPGDF